MKKFNLVLELLLLTALFSPIANADMDQIKAIQAGFSITETKQLPPFCLGLSESFFAEEAKHLKKNIPVIGEHSHHFCLGMKAMLRGFYDHAVNEFDYVLGHSSLQGVTLPAAYLYRAEALAKLGNNREAIEGYSKAIQLKPTYKQAYTKFSDFYVKIGMPKDALDIINMGLRYSPDARSLKTRLAKLTASK